MEKDIEKQLIILNPGEYDEVKLPAKPVVCERCQGTGKHTNPAIDGNGLSAEDFAEDPDFKEAYFGGVYDIPCENCRGIRIDLVPEDPKNPDWVNYEEYLAEVSRENELRSRGIQF